MTDKAFSIEDLLDKMAKPEVNVFKNRKVMTSSYIPKSLPNREEEMKKLILTLGVLLKGGTPQNAFLYGKTGIGKTAVTKSVIAGLKKKADEMEINLFTTYINCRVVDTTYRIYAHLCNSIDVEVPMTGLPTDEIISKFMTELEKKKTHNIIVLDEIDFLVKKSSKALYVLTRMNSDLQNSSISLIGITNDLQFKHLMDARVRSTLTEREITFDPYTKPQIERIIKERAKEGLYDGVLSTPALNKAAAAAAQEHGDARRAIDLIRVAGELVESEARDQITEKDIETAQNIIESNAVMEVTRSLPLQAKLVLISTTILDERREKGDPIKSSEVYEHYVEICSKIGMDSLTQRRVGDLINDLDLLGMISTSVVSKGRYGRSRVITLSVSPSEIKSILSVDPIIKLILE